MGQTTKAGRWFGIRVLDLGQHGTQIGHEPSVVFGYAEVAEAFHDSGLLSTTVKDQFPQISREGGRLKSRARSRHARLTGARKSAKPGSWVALRVPVLGGFAFAGASWRFVERWSLR